MRSKTHVKLSGSKRGRNISPKAIRVRDVEPETEITVTITLRGRKTLPRPEKFVGEKMTHAELKEQFGAEDKVADKVAGFLRKQNLRLKNISLLTRSMQVTGTADELDSVFMPEEWGWWRSLTQGSYLGRAGKIYIPKELTGLVTGVFGLDQRQMARRRGAGPKVNPIAPGHLAARSGMKPSDIEERYQFPRGDGSGQRIAVAQFGGGYLADDVSLYCKMARKPTPKVKLISVNAPAYTLKDILAIPDPSPRKFIFEQSFEVTTDVEIIAGLCPKASISVYFATFDERGWVDLLNKVITANPSPVALSISWGFPEDEEHDQWTDDGIEAINDRLNMVRLLGITTCVASGDDGCRGEVEKTRRAHVDFPSASPHVMSVGGTMLDASGNEVTWSDDPDHPEGATGGGVSTIFLRPAWQAKIPSLNRNSIDGRVVPDVAALAGKPYYQLFFAKFPWLGGKTSASAPVWAALIARINANLPRHKRQRFLTPLLYKEMGKGNTVGDFACRDIEIGHNKCLWARLKGYYACKGFDAVTGWGVPNGKELLNCLKQI